MARKTVRIRRYTKRKVFTMSIKRFLELYEPVPDGESEDLDRYYNEEIN